MAVKKKNNNKKKKKYALVKRTKRAPQARTRILSPATHYYYSHFPLLLSRNNRPNSDNFSPNLLLLLLKSIQVTYINIRSRTYLKVDLDEVYKLSYTLWASP
ncbi:hypothetical protein Hanom_Chr14g01332241 [Helianthus anomalus]